MIEEQVDRIVELATQAGLVDITSFKEELTKYIDSLNLGKIYCSYCGYLCDVREEMNTHIISCEKRPEIQLIETVNDMSRLIVALFYAGERFYGSETGKRLFGDLESLESKLRVANKSKDDA